MTDLELTDNQNYDIHIGEVVIATATFSQSLAFWHEHFGYEVCHLVTTTDPSLLALWQVSEQDIGRRALLAIQGAHTKIHLVEVLQPAAPLKQGVGNLDALPKTLNLLVKDLPSVWQRLSDAGVHMKTKWVEYEEEGVTYRDAHIIGPDESGIGLLEAVGEDYPVNLHNIGEPASFVCTVESMSAESKFYRALGCSLRLDHEFSGPAIEQLVGLPSGASLHMQLFGPQKSHSRIELVSYGSPMHSHYSRAKFPHTGALFACLNINASAQQLAEKTGATFHSVSLWGEDRQLAKLRSPAGATVILSAAKP